MIEVTENIIQISQENDVINVSVVEQPIEIVANNVVYRESPTDKTPYWGFIEGTLADQTDLVLEFEKKANISHEHATSDVTGLDAKLTSYDTHVADTVVHVTQTNKDYWSSKAAGDHNHATVYEPKNSNIQTHIGTSTIHVSIADRLSWDGKAAFIHYHSYNDLTDKPNLTLKANQTALDATNANVTALQTVSHSHSNSAALATVINTGDGTKFHANDGTYKTVTAQVQNITTTVGSNYIETSVGDLTDTDAVYLWIKQFNTGAEYNNTARLRGGESYVDIQSINGTNSSSSLQVYGKDSVFIRSVGYIMLNSDANIYINIPTKATGKWLKCTDGVSGMAEWSDLPTGSGASWGSITGTLSAQTDLATALSQKALQSDLTTTNSNVSSLSTAVSNISTDLDTAETNITALQTNKADKTEIPTVPTALSSFTKDINFDERYYTETEIDSALSGKAPLSHSQAISTVTGLQTALDGKAPTTHNHTLAGLTEKSYNSLTDKPTIPTVPTALSAFTNDLTVYYLKTETYSKTETDGLLSGKSATTHNHDTAYEAKNANIQAHISSTAVHLTTTEKTNVGKLISNGNGLSFLANDGTYKSVSISFASLTGNPTDNTALAAALSGKAPLSHTHSISNVTDLQTTLDSKAASTHNHTLAGLSEKSYLSLTDKPTIPTVPTALSGFTNDLTAYYSKTETYTQTEINTALSAKMKAHSIASGTQTSLTLDLATNNIFNIELSANASFSISNPETTRDYYFYVKNTSASAITITLPNTADIVAAATQTITAAKTRAFAMQWNGTKRIWQISEEIA